jgi:hypothetical protein
MANRPQFNTFILFSFIFLPLTNWLAPSTRLPAHWLLACWGLAVSFHHHYRTIPRSSSLYRSSYVRPDYNQKNSFVSLSSLNDGNPAGRILHSLGK